MTKLNFLLSLHEKLSGLPQKEVEERLNFYSEVIEDRIEEGLSEEEAVSAVGTVDEIAAQIIADIYQHKTETEQDKSKRQHKMWIIVLLVLGAPIWLSLLITTFAIFLSIFASLWSAIISLWAVFVSIAACTLSSILLGIGFIISKKTLPGFGLITAGIICAGLTILLFFGCKAATKGTVLLTKKSAKIIQKTFARKENAK